MVLALQTLATLTAEDRGLSLVGSYGRAPGWLPLLSYGLLFLLVAACLRGREQIDHLVLALVAAAPPLVILGGAQAFGWFPLPLFTDARSSVYATLGRSNSLGAYLALLVPLTLSLLVNAVRERRMALAFLFAGELTVIALTGACGAWLALGAVVARIPMAIL